MATIDTVFNAGDDALTYEWQMSFGPIPYLDVATNFNIRCQSVDIPPITIGEYSIEYKTDTIVKPNGKNTTAKEFTTEFRVDKYWKLYNALRLWSNSIVSTSGGVATDSLNGVSTIRIPITITTGMTDIDGNFVPTGGLWSFTGSWPKSVGNPTLDNSSAEPATTSITWGYLKLL